MRVALLAFAAVFWCGGLYVQAQSPATEFDVVSIKRNTSGLPGNSMRTLPDGTAVQTNTTIESIIRAAAPGPADEVIGLPGWARSERYDIVAKPPAGSTREQRSLMWQAMFAERMKLAAHMEERDRDVFALVLARSDGRLGPQLRPSTLECPTTPGAPPASGSTLDDFENSCSARVGLTGIASGSMSLDTLAGQLRGFVGSRVTNRTGLQGRYAVRLTYSRRSIGGPPTNPAPPDEPPEIFTALQEQLGLKLQGERARVPVFVVDHIERPSEN